MRTLVLLTLVAAIATSCAGGGDQAATNSHGGYSGKAAHWYDVGVRECGKQTQQGDGGGPSKTFLLPSVPGRYHKALSDGCNAGGASSSCIAIQLQTATSSLSCTFDGTPTSEP